MESIKELAKQADFNYLSDDDWLAKDKHVFVLSESGKPIYSRFGDENKLVTLFGVMQALVSFANLPEGDDEIQSVHVGSHRFVFLKKKHFILVLVIKDNFAKWTESTERLRLQLHFIYNSILSTFSLTQLNRIFENQCNFDLRQSITNHKQYFNRILDWMDCASFLFTTVECVPMTVSVRQSVTDTLNQVCSKTKNLVFAMILMGDKLVTVSRLKKFYLPMNDFHLILRLLQLLGLDDTIETWSPICLAEFDLTGFMHCYSACLLKSYELKIVLLTTEKDAFYKCQEIRERFLQKFETQPLSDLVPNSWLISNLNEDLEKLLQSEFQNIQFVFYKIDKSDYGFIEWLKHESFRNEMYKIACHFYDLTNLETNKNGPKLCYDCDMKWKCFAQKGKSYQLIVISDPVVSHTCIQDSVQKIVKIVKKNQDRYFFQNDSNVFNC